MFLNRNTAVLKNISMPFILLCLFSFLGLAEDDAPGQTWPMWRGANSDNIVSGAGMFGDGKNLSLKTVWKKKIGPAYSTIAVAEGRVVTMYSDGRFDNAIAFDAESGDELWQYRIDSTYKGHDGSHDGPIATPVISGGKVFLLDPYGGLTALNNANGEKVWSTDLVKDHKAMKPYYGFTASPLVVGDVLVVQTGGTELNAISGFNKNSGELLWTAGGDTVTYQSPMIGTVDGKTQVIGVGNKVLYGINPGNGLVNWEYKYGGDGSPIGSGCLNPVPAGEGRFFLPYRATESAMVDLRMRDTEISGEAVWQTKKMKMSYVTPVYVKGYVVGYSGRFMTALDAKTGDVAWKSRQPGDGFPIVVDDHLVIITKKGSLHVAKVSEKGYEEIAHSDLFEDLSWSTPSIAYGKIYVRSLGEIACVQPVSAAQIASAESETVEDDAASGFAAELQKIQSATDKPAAVEAFLTKQKTFPIIENGNTVHFVYRGDAEDVAITGDLIGARHEEPMQQLEGTNLFYYTTPAAADARVNYNFVKNFENSIIDSLNSRVIPSDEGGQSWFAMPNWQDADYLQDAAANRGTIDSLEMTSKVDERTRMIHVYLPHGYENSDARYPVAYVHSGDAAREQGRMIQTLDNLSGKEIQPMIMVFIPPHPAPRNPEFLGPFRDKYSEMLVTELVPAIDAKYRTIPKAASRANIGMGDAGYLTVYASYKHAGVFDNVSSQSLIMLTVHERMLHGAIEAAEASPAKIYMDWGKYGLRAAQEGWDMTQMSRDLFAYLKARGDNVIGAEYNTGHGWANSRHRNDLMLKAFFPLEK